MNLSTKSEETHPQSQADLRVQKILDKIESLKTEIESIKTPPTQKETPSKTEDPLEHVHSCPECSKKLQAEKEAYANEKILKRNKDIITPVRCMGENCGMILDVTEKECPNCHGKRAAKI